MLKASFESFLHVVSTSGLALWGASASQIIAEMFSTGLGENSFACLLDHSPIILMLLSDIFLFFFSFPIFSHLSLSFHLCHCRIWAGGRAGGGAQTLTSTESLRRGSRLNLFVGEGPVPSGLHSSSGCRRRGHLYYNVFYSHSDIFWIRLGTEFLGNISI